ncbi:hypothetical protein H0H92_008221, partial [Tricholoma furcatifolium]
MNDFDLVDNPELSVVERKNQLIADIRRDKRPTFTTQACEVVRAVREVLENPVLVNIDAGPGQVTDNASAIHSDSGSAGLPLQNEFAQVLDDLQRSNYRPALHHTAVLKSLVEQGNSELSMIDQSISQVQQHIDEMTSAVRQLRDLRRQKLKKTEYYRSWLCTARLLPIDILVSIFKPFLSHPGGLFTALETLVLVDETRWEPKDRPNPDIAAGVPRISVFNNSPNLHSLTLRTNQPLLGPKAPLFPWAQLNRLEVQSPTSVQEFIVSLVWCHQRLRTAIYHSVALGDPNDIEGYPVPDTPVTFGQLVELQVSMAGIYRSPYDIALVVSMLRVPSVRTLALRTFTWLSEMFPLEGVLLPPVPGGVFPPLQKLSLYHPDIDELGDFARIFGGCPQLEALCLCVDDENVDAEGLLGTLTLLDSPGSDSNSNNTQNLNNNMQPLLPHLTNLIFIFEGRGILESTEAYAVADVFGALVASRTRTSINSRGGPASGRPSPLSKAT